VVDLIPSFNFVVEVIVLVEVIDVRLDKLEQNANTLYFGNISLLVSVLIVILTLLIS